MFPQTMNTTSSNQNSSYESKVISRTDVIVNAFSAANNISWRGIESQMAFKIADYLMEARLIIYFSLELIAGDTLPVPGSTEPKKNCP